MLGAAVLCMLQACSSDLSGPAGDGPGAMENMGAQEADPHEPRDRAEGSRRGAPQLSPDDAHESETRPGVGVASNMVDAAPSDADAAAGDPEDDTGTPDSGEGTETPVDDREKGAVRDAGDSPPREVPPDLTGVEALLCDGDPGITFAGRMLPTGLTAPGGGVMTENGFRFLLVEGTCRYWVQRGKLERVVTGSLTKPNLEMLRNALDLDNWQALAGDYPIGFPGAPDIAYILGRGGLQTPCGSGGATGGRGGCVHVGGSSATGSADLRSLHMGFAEALEHLYTAGEAVQGDIRYLLVRGKGILPDQVYSAPSGWPLGDPEDFAIDEAEINQTGYMPGTGRLATGEAATQLRQVWQRFIDFEVSGRFEGQPPSGSEAIPIEVMGVRYQLFVRDAVPLEEASGLIAY